MANSMKKLDCVVIGAGWYGLAAAKQYHCTQPEASLAIFDAQSTLGGVWADTRLYPGLKSNNLLGTYQYPDFPMDGAALGVQPGQHIPGEVINKYLKAYAANFGILELVRPGIKITTADHQEDGGWILTARNLEKGDEYRVFARRLIVGSGLSSEGFLPHFAGQEEFGGRIFHVKEFPKNSDTVKTAKAVAIFGGHKSSFDAAYAYATAGVQVHWIIRASGHGPCWMTPPHVTPMKRWVEELANTRFLSWFSPCIWGDEDGYSGIRNFYHGSVIGRYIVDTFWKVLGSDAQGIVNLGAHPETAKLVPWTPAMFAGTSFSFFNYETDFRELVRDGSIKVYITEFDHLSPGKIHLSDGTSLECDVLLANTGWKHVPPIKFLPHGIDRELGFPHPPLGPGEVPASPDEDLGSQLNLIEKADKEILARFPRLRDQPAWNKNYAPVTDLKGVNSNDAVSPYQPLTPYMLHHFIVPPSERLLKTRDIAFVGLLSNFSNPITAHLHGLWVSAYFSGLLARDPGAAVGDSDAMERLRYKTVLYNRFGHWRYPTDWGSNRGPSFIFDAVPYLDLLQRDLGLNPHRKNGRLREMYKPYKPEDYYDTVEEWMSKYKAS